MVISSPCLIDNKELTSPEQTAPGKDFSNPLIVDSLLKTIWSSMHHVFTMKHWLVQSKRLLKPDICVSFIKQFWRSAEVTTAKNGEVKITATIDGHSMTITEGSLRRHLKLNDQDGISSIPNSEIFEQLALMGYHTDSDDPKKTAWEQFISNIGAALICLATNRKYNFSRMIFEHMVSNISSPHKFLMYPRFIQLCLDMQRNQLQQHTRSYPVPSLSMKVFNNMKRPTKGFSGQEVALFPTMLDVTEPSTSPSRITSSPSPSPDTSPSHSPEPSTQHSPDNTTAAASQPSPTQPSPTHPSPGAEHHFSPPHDSPLHAVHSHGSDEGSLKLNELMNLVTKLSDRIGVLEDDLKKTKKTYSSAYTKLILRVKKLESQIKTGKARRKARVVLSDDEVIEDDSSKQGRKLSDAEVQEKASTETELFIQEVTPTEVIQDQEGSEKGSDEVSTAGAKKGTASGEVPIVSTAEGSLKLDELTNLVTKLSDRIEVLEDDLRKTKKTYSSTFTKLILRVKKLESQIKTGKARRKARIVHSDDEDIEDDSSKQGRNEKGSAKISTVGAIKGTASEVPVVSTAEENISTAGRTVTYRRRSEEQRTRKDKGKAIMIEASQRRTRV
ncbi:hypothetical protein Tco_0492859 [Tanacetum coccineum]